MDVQDADREDAVAVCVQQTCTEGKCTEQGVPYYKPIKAIKNVKKNGKISVSGKISPKFRSHAKEWGSQFPRIPK